MTWTHPTSCLSASVMLPCLMETRYVCHQAQVRKSGNLMEFSASKEIKKSSAQSTLLLCDHFGIGCKHYESPSLFPLSVLIRGDTSKNTKRETKAGCIYGFTWRSEYFFKWWIQPPSFKCLLHLQTVHIIKKHATRKSVLSKNPYLQSPIYVICITVLMYDPMYRSWISDVHPRRFTRNLRIHRWKKKNIFQFTIFQVQAVTPQKINMEHNNEGLEDHFPF